MEELEKIADLKKKISDYEEQLKNLYFKNTAPKNQIFSDMPKGGNNGNSIEEYIIKMEKIENIITGYHLMLSKHWYSANIKFKKAGLTSLEIELLKYRFLCNYKWKNCIMKMQKKHPEMKWTENRVFFAYRAIRDKLAMNGEYI